jgi:peroxiredoxin
MIVLPLIALLIAQEPIAAASEALVGKPAPRVQLELVNGKRFDLAQQKGKVVFLAFWATWCEPCRRDIPVLLDARSEYRDLVVIGVSSEPAADVRDFLTQERFEFPSAIDADGKVSKAYGIDLVPRLFVIDQKGIVVKMIRGLPSERAIQRALEPLLR